MVIFFAQVLREGRNGRETTCPYGGHLHSPVRVRELNGSIEGAEAIIGIFLDIFPVTCATSSSEGCAPESVLYDVFQRLFSKEDQPRL
jgi:hypothetical protein